MSASRGPLSARRSISAVRIAPLAPTLIVIALLVLACGDQPASPTVVRVIDGDTFELSDGQRVRLIGIDTPETHVSQKLQSDIERSGRDRATIRALGARATHHATDLVEGKPVLLEFDQGNAASDHRDRYDRTLAYVWVADSDGNPLFCVNKRMLADGYANAYTRFPFEKMEEFREAERRARHEQRGLWADDALAPLADVVLEPGSAASGEAAAASRCTATTRAGNQCRRMTRHVSGRCWQHL